LGDGIDAGAAQGFAQEHDVRQLQVMVDDEVSMMMMMMIGARRQSWW
jgi:hypothetical protein